VISTGQGEWNRGYTIFEKEGAFRDKKRATSFACIGNMGKKKGKKTFIERGRGKTLWPSKMVKKKYNGKQGKLRSLREIRHIHSLPEGQGGGF